jgi:hypothetical protein
MKIERRRGVVGAAFEMQVTCVLGGMDKIGVKAAKIGVKAGIGSSFKDSRMKVCRPV